MHAYGSSDRLHTSVSRGGENAFDTCTANTSNRVYVVYTLSYEFNSLDSPLLQLLSKQILLNFLDPRRSRILHS